MTSERRIEDFRSDLVGPAVDEGQALNTRAIAMQAYLYALPSFLHLRQLTEFLQGRAHFAPDACPLGGWVLMRELADPTTTTVSPNVDTLYGATYVLLDRQGPVVLSVPAIADRYWSVAMLDASFDNFFVAEASTVGTEGGHVLVVPRGWSGETPAYITRVVESPTPSVCMIQRIYTRDKSEYDHLHALQDEIVVVPLAQWLRGERLVPDVDVAEYRLEAVRQTTSPIRFFELTNAYLAANPPPSRDEGLASLFRDAGVGPGATVPVDPVHAAAVVGGARDAQTAIDALLSSRPTHGGWRLPDPHAGHSEGPLVERAATQLTQMGLLPLTEAVYYFAYTDADGRQLRGTSGATLTFGADALPPHEPLGFWSLTVYDERSLLVANELDRYVIRSDTPGLQRDPDGRLTLHLHCDRPDGLPHGNWLPAPEGRFTVALRIYRPLPAVLDGSWPPPPLHSIAPL
jgi:hypothetical protein